MIEVIKRLEKKKTYTMSSPTRLLLSFAAHLFNFFFGGEDYLIYLFSSHSFFPQLSATRLTAHKRIAIINKKINIGER